MGQEEKHECVYISEGSNVAHRIVMPRHKMCSVILRVVLKGDK